MRWALAWALLLAGCGGEPPWHFKGQMEDAPPGIPDAAQPVGQHHHYVVDRIRVPTTPAEATAFGLDLDGDDAGTVDNAWGGGLAAFASAGFDVQATTDRMIADGGIILLLDLQTTDFTNAPEIAGVRFFVGTQPSTTPCAGSGDTTCGHHLDGMTTFVPTPVRAPLYPALAGRITDGVFDGNYSGYSSILQIGTVSEVPLEVGFEHLRVVATDLSPTRIGELHLAGAFDDLTFDQPYGGGIVGAIAKQLAPLVAFDCRSLASPPGCGCTDGSLGQHLLSYFERTPQDCTISQDEVRASPLGALSPDVRFHDGTLGVSVGVELSAVPAIFDDPPEEP